jgi:hypothetical protein
LECLSAKQTLQQHNNTTQTPPEPRACHLPLSIVFCILGLGCFPEPEQQNSRTAEQQNRKPKLSRPSSVVQYSSCCRRRRRRRRQLVFILSCLEASCRTRTEMKTPTITVHNHNRLGFPLQLQFPFLLLFHSTANSHSWKQLEAGIWNWKQ